MAIWTRDSRKGELNSRKMLLKMNKGDLDSKMVNWIQEGDSDSRKQIGAEKGDLDSDKSELGLRNSELDLRKVIWI